MKRACLLFAVSLGWGMASATASEVTVLGNDSMPYCGLLNGKPAGMAVDILNTVTRNGGPTFKFDFSAPWSRSQVLVHEQPGTAIIPLTRTSEREPKYKWIAELFPYKGHLITVGRAAPLNSIAEAKDLEVGMLNGSSLQPILVQSGFTKIQLVPNDETNARKMGAGHLGAWAVSQYIEKYLYAKIGQDPEKLQIGPEIGDLFHIYIAADPSFPDADAQAITSAVERMRSSGELETILARYR